MPDAKYNKDKKSRCRLFGEDNPVCKLPDCDSVVRKAFLDCGLAMSGAMSMVPLSWSEVSAYNSLSGVSLSPWEAENVIMMSREYCSFLTKAKDETCVQPYWPDMNDDEMRSYHQSIESLTNEMKKEDDKIAKPRRGNVARVKRRPT